MAYNKILIQEAIAFLCNNGYIYSTIGIQGTVCGVLKRREVLFCR